MRFLGMGMTGIRKIMDATKNYRLDIIGDVHGELGALNALGKELGYDADWRHPEGRLPVFLGDLIDRGADSFKVASLVRRLVSEKRGFCLLGNHEANLLAWHFRHPRYLEPKPSNRDTIAAIEADRRRWLPLLEFFRDLPIAVALPDLRLVHACWHAESFARVRDLLAPTSTDADAGDSAFDYMTRHVALGSPFNERGFIEGLPGADAISDVHVPHDDFLKGFETPIDKPFHDNSGKTRHHRRVRWWQEQTHQVVNDRTVVFGHYWHLPPLKGHFAPPLLKGEPGLDAWAREIYAACPPTGRLPLDAEYACIDFNGVSMVDSRVACIGALRLPEREIVWASAPSR